MSNLRKHHRARIKNAERNVLDSAYRKFVVEHFAMDKGIVTFTMGLVETAFFITGPSHGNTGNQNARKNKAYRK